jgi:hypothetical protein
MHHHFSSNDKPRKSMASGNMFKMIFDGIPEKCMHRVHRREASPIASIASTAPTAPTEQRQTRAIKEGVKAIRSYFDNSDCKEVKAIVNFYCNAYDAGSLLSFQTLGH